MHIDIATLERELLSVLDEKIYQTPREIHAALIKKLVGQGGTKSTCEKAISLDRIYSKLLQLCSDAKVQGRRRTSIGPDGRKTKPVCEWRIKPAQ